MFNGVVVVVGLEWYVKVGVMMLVLVCVFGVEVIVCVW